jgi:peptidoglycan/LPS O-acetylase OafA/YrhL
MHIRWPVPAPTVRVPVVAAGRQRWPAFDALRGLAMLLGVVLHAAVSYMPHTMPGLVWAVRDRDTSPVFDWLFWCIHGFRLPLFFALAGFLSAGLHEARGPWGYLRHRSQRLLVPLLGGIVLVLPGTFGVWSWGWLQSGLCTLREIRRMHFSPALQAALYGPAHLWFLEYLYAMCLLFCGARWVQAWWSAGIGDGAPRSDWRDRWLASRWFLLVPAVPAAVIVWLEPGAVYHFHNSFVPEPFRFTYYGIFFVAGTWLARGRTGLDRCLGLRSRLCLALCLPVLIANGLLVQAYLESGLGGLGRLALAGTCALFAALALFGLLGLALRWCPRERPLLRYLADASYWIYLVHFPLVGLGQVILAPVPGPALVKFVVVTTLVLAFGLWTYHRVVRTTVLGLLLNGTKPAVVRSSSPRRSAAA